MPRRVSTTKLTLLPENFEALLQAGDLRQLKAVFDACELDARHGDTRRTALAFEACPGALAQWLVAQGADLECRNSLDVTPLAEHAGRGTGMVRTLIALGANLEARSNEGTPLHHACGRHQRASVAALLAAGADVEVQNARGHSPLEHALDTCRDVDLADMAKIAKLLLAHGAARTPRMKDMITRAGEAFEAHRSRFDPRHLKVTDRALRDLYRLFAVPPVPRRAPPDGVAPMAVSAEGWRA